MNDLQKKQLGYLLAFKTMASTIADRIENGPLGDIELPEPFPTPAGCEQLLYDSAKRHDAKHPTAVTITRAAVTGRLRRLTVRLNKRIDGTTYRTVTGIFKSPNLSGVRLHFSDANSTAEEIDAFLGLPLGTTVDITPPGRLKRLHRQVQFVADITKQTPIERVVRIVRQLLLVCPDKKRVGIITLQGHAAKLLAALPPKLAERIALITHYRSGDDRGSNLFVEKKCDLLICLGTPHVAATALQDWMLRRGVPDFVINSDGKWHRVDGRQPDRKPGGPIAFSWCGWTESGKKLRVIRCGGYAEWDWYDAFEAVVVGQLKQAIGRARTCNPDGMDVIAVSQQDLKLKLLEQQGLTAAELEVVEALAAALVNDTILSNILERTLSLSPGVSTAQIAAALGKPERSARIHLPALLSKGWIVKFGDKRGCKWTLADFSPQSPFDSPPGPPRPFPTTPHREHQPGAGAAHANGVCHAAS